jgi:hypothetical protein
MGYGLANARCQGQNHAGFRVDWYVYAREFHGRPIISNPRQITTKELRLGWLLNFAAQLLSNLLSHH